MAEIFETVSWTSLSIHSKLTSEIELLPVLQFCRFLALIQPLLMRFLRPFAMRVIDQYALGPHTGNSRKEGDVWPQHRDRLNKKRRSCGRGSRDDGDARLISERDIPSMSLTLVRQCPKMHCHRFHRVFFFQFHHYFLSKFKFLSPLTAPPPLNSKSVPPHPHQPSRLPAFYMYDLRRTFS